VVDLDNSSDRENISQRKNINSNQLASSSHIRKVKYLSTALIFMVSLGLGFFGGWIGSRYELNNNGQGIQKQIVSQQGDIIRNIASQVGQSVVSINDTQMSDTSVTNSFFNFPQQGTSTQQAAGTGIILTTSGYVVTNRHVVPDGATNVSITLSNGVVLNDVSVVGRTSTNDTLDIAILKINNLKGQKLVAAQLGDSNAVQVGDGVVAIGNALGQFQNTVTSGIISGYGRSIKASDSSGSSSENLDGLLQTDAAINEGNSGGPLVNFNSQVIGINVATAASANSIGFSIPINDIKGMVSNLEATGKFERPYLGVLYAPIDAATKAKYNLSVDNGAYILPYSVSGQSGIMSDSPASNAGLKEGDIITQVNGQDINSKNTLTSLVDTYGVGTKINLTVIRSGKTISVPIVVGAKPAQ